MKAPALLLALVLPTAVAAGEADVLAVEVARQPDGRFRFDVTVRHADAGWDHYADAWQILAPDGTLLGERILLHPHDDEQPFTRSLGDVAVPDEVAEVQVRARDNVHGLGGEEMRVALPR